MNWLAVVLLSLSDLFESIFIIFQAIQVQVFFEGFFLDAV